MQQLDLMDLGPNSVMVVHGGGIYGDIEETKKRWCEQYKLLPENVQRRLVMKIVKNVFQYKIV